MPNVIKFDGVEGESKITGYENWIEIGPFELRVNHPYSGIGTGGSSGGKAQFAPISISKRVDVASMTLLNKMVFGNHFDKVQIVSLKTTGGTTLEKFFSLDLSEVHLSDFHYHNGGDDSGDYMNESWVLGYKKIELTHLPQTAKGVLGPEGTFGIDLEKYEQP